MILPIGEAVTRKLGTNPLRVVSFQEWFSLVERRAMSASDRDLKNIVSSHIAIQVLMLTFVKPAIKLLETFRAFAEADLAVIRKGDNGLETGGFPKFSTEKTKSVSLTMKELQPIGARDAELWVSYWSSVGLFD